MYIIIPTADIMIIQRFHAKTVSFNVFSTPKVLPASSSRVHSSLASQTLSGPQHRSLSVSERVVTEVNLLLICYPTCPFFMAVILKLNYSYIAGHAWRYTSIKHKKYIVVYSSLNAKCCGEQLKF